MSKLYTRCRNVAVASAVLLGAACGGSGGTGPEVLTPEEVAGNYRVCELAFVPDGGVPGAANILAVLDTASLPPRLEIGNGAAQRQFSLIYRLNDGGTTQIISGSYVTGSQHLNLALGTGPAVRRLLLPENLRLNLDGQTRGFIVTQEQPAHEIAKADYEALTGQVLPPAIRDRFTGRLSARFVQGTGPCS